MNDKVKIFRELKGGHDKYKSIKGKIEHVQGRIDDIRKLHSFASNLIRKRVGSSSVLLKLTYEGVTRLSGFLPTPYLSHYLQFYQSGINVLSQLYRVTDESKLVVDWSRGLHKSATEFENAIDSLVDKFSYASAMVDQDGSPSVNMPAGLKDYLERLDEYEESTKDVRNAIKNVDWSKKAQAVETVGFHLEYAAGQHKSLLQRKQALSKGIIYQARDIAAAHAHFAFTYSKIMSAGDNANKTMKRLTSSTDNIDSIAGLGTKRKMTYGEYDRVVVGLEKNGEITPGLANEDVNKLMEGNWEETTDFKRMKRAMQKMRYLSNDWSLWASWSANGKFMQLV
jgi:hypothetical protein